MHYLEEIERVLPMLKEKKTPVSKKQKWKDFTKEYPNFTELHNILFKTYFYQPITKNYEIEIPEALIDIIKEIEVTTEPEQIKRYFNTFITQITNYLHTYYVEKFNVLETIASSMAGDMDMKTRQIMNARLEAHFILKVEK